MAEEVELSVSVEYSGKKKIFSFPKHYEVRKALYVIGDYYKQPPASICLLYMGVEIAEGTVLKVTPHRKLYHTRVRTVFAGCFSERSHRYSARPQQRWSDGSTPGQDGHW